MSSQEEAKQWLTKAWEAMWLSDSSTIPEFFTEDAELSAFTPPKQTTWKGVPEIVAHFKEIQPILTMKSFNIKRIDLVQDSQAFYAAWDASFELKVPGREGTLEGGGIMYCLREGGKAKIWTAYEDPTPFVEMAMKGQMKPH